MPGDPVAPDRVKTNAIGTKGVPRAEREAQIIDAAVEEFARHGYSGGSMVTIAAEAGISKPLIYQYFGSKDGLYLVALHSVATALLEQIESAWTREDESVLSRLTTIRSIFEALEPRRIGWRLLYDESMPRTGPIADAAQDYRDRTKRVAASGSERFLRARGFADPDDTSALSAVWMGLVDSLVSWWIEHPDETSTAMIERCTRLVIAVMTPPAEGS